MFFLVIVLSMIKYYSKVNPVGKFVLTQDGCNDTLILKADGDYERSFSEIVQVTIRGYGI